MTMAAAAPTALLWIAGVAASVIAAVAFVLWGTQGATFLFDMIVAMCT